MNPKNKKEWPLLEIKCIKCDIVKWIPQRNKHRNSICRECAAKASREYNRKKAIELGKRIGQAGRFPYPLGEWEYPNQKFNSMAKELKNCTNRKEGRELIRRNLDNALEDKELMDWINMHDFEERREEAERKRRVRKGIKENIDTRNITWEQLEQMGWGEEWDD